MVKCFVSVNLLYLNGVYVFWNSSILYYFDKKFNKNDQLLTSHS